VGLVSPVGSRSTTRFFNCFEWMVELIAACVSGPSVATATTTKSFEYFFASLFRNFSSWIQGLHQVAHQLTTTTLPLYWETEVYSPSIEVSFMSGASGQDAPSNKSDMPNVIILSIFSFGGGGGSRTPVPNIFDNLSFTRLAGFD